MSLLILIITAILIFFFLRLYFWEITGVLTLLLVYIAMPVILIFSVISVVSLFYDRAERIESIENEIINQGERYKLERKQIEYWERVRDFSPKAYDCIKETEEEFYKNSHQGVTLTIQTIEDSLFYRNCMSR